MGGTESTENNPKLKVFSNDERQRIHELFLNISKNQKTVNKVSFKRYLPNWWEPHLRDRLLFQCVLHSDQAGGGSHGNKADPGFTEAQFGVFLAMCLKGMYTEQAEILCLLSEATGGQVSCVKLKQVVSSLIKSYLRLSKSDQSYQTWHCQTTDAEVEKFSGDLLTQDLTQDGSRSRDDVETWLSKSPLFLLMFERIFRETFRTERAETSSHSPVSLVPTASDIDWSRVATVLDTTAIIYLNHHLPRMQQAEWRFLYSNHLYGDSFSQLITHITAKGPNVIIIKDKDGHVFGAYVSESWDINSQFFGSSSCFLFTLSPHFGVFSATGYNSNFMYLNQGVQTLPNGLGLGGQLNYFGLWIDQSFNAGHSKAQPKCTTYGSPQLSGKPEFEVEVVEVWAVGPDLRKLDDEEEEGHKSILDKDVGAKAILEMAGKKQVSEGLRDLTEDEDMSEEMKKKMNVIPKLL